MISSDVIKSINEWTDWASQDSVQRYDIALFKIWIQFELFVGDLFVTYSTGQKSEKGYAPKLKIKFQDEEQFNVFMRQGSKLYVEYLDRIEKLSRHIFDSDPFDILLHDANLSPALDQMKALRNYIAHESGEAKRKLINTCFNGDEKKFIEPNDFLKSKEKTTKQTYYTFYINMIKNIIEILIMGIN